MLIIYRCCQSSRRFIRSVLQGFLPGLSLKLSLTFLPQLMMFLSKFEGRVSLSKIERNAATKYFVVMVVNVFFGNVIVGSVFEQLKHYVDSPIRCGNSLLRFSLISPFPEG